MRFLFFTHVVFFLYLTSASARDVSVDGVSAVMDSSDSTLYLDYSKHHLYKGREFVPYTLSVVGSPNYADLKMLDNCSLVYDGVQYDGVPLMYDLSRDILISRHPERLVNIILEKHQVSSFTLGDDRFVFYRGNDPSLQFAIYQEIYRSDSFVCYARRKKEIKDYSNGPVLERRYVASVAFYIQDLHSTEGFREIKKQSDLLNLDRTKRKEIRRALNQLDIRFRTQPEQAIIRTLEYLDLQ